MSDSPMYEAMRKYIDVKVELEVRKALPELTRSLSEKIPKEGPPGKDGKDGRDGQDGKNGSDGRDGTPGKDGERGADGFATPEDLERAVEKLQVRAFADLYQGVYQPDRLYQRSALVTWGGSLFLALNETKARPAESADWRLIVKAGRDGKR